MRVVSGSEHTIEPAPNAAEAAAIVAAIEALWPRPIAAVEPAHDRSTAWRFSGRWWLRDRFARTDRPWR